MENAYVRQTVNILVKFFKFMRDKPKYKTMEMLEEFRGEDGAGMDLIQDGEFSKAVGYFGKMLKKYPRSVFFRVYKGIALCGLERYDEAIVYFDEIIEISDYWKNKYLPTFNDLSVITCSTLLNKARVLDTLYNQEGTAPCYDKIIEISEFLLGWDKEEYRKNYDLLSEEARVNYHPRGKYYDVLPYRARAHIRKGEVQDLIMELREFLTKRPQQYLHEDKEYLLSELKKEIGFDKIKNDPQIIELLEKD